MKPVKSKESFLFCGILIVLVSVSNTNGANILFFSGVSTYSHRIVVWPYVEKLTEIGHKVTFLSGFPPKEPNPNVTEYTPQVLQKLIGSLFGGDADLISFRETGNRMGLWSLAEEAGIQQCELLMKDPDYINFVKTNHFDLVIVDFLFNECAYGIVRYNNAKLIMFDTSHPVMWQYDAYGMPAETSWVPDLIGHYPRDMSFLDRVGHAIWPLRWHFHRVFSMYPRLEAVMNAGFNWVGDQRISIREMELETNLVLMNSHFSVDYARSLPPLFVPVGGLHLKSKSNKLPHDIQKFADESGGDGFIYVSFGTGISISKAKPKIREAFFKAFRNSSKKFIWKWDGPRPAEMPENVLTASWMPQAEILAHPNIKAFITHGGLLGITEALVNAVPMIAFPCFAEQDYNADRMEAIGYGIKMEFVGLKQRDLENAIQRVLTNPSYKITMQEVSKRFLDRQNTPLETAIWWTEYILRHEKTQLLSPMGRYQYWFVRRSVDVWGFIIGTFGLLVGIVIGCAMCWKRISYKNLSKKND